MPLSRSASTRSPPSPFSATLALPKTDFPLRARAAERDYLFRPRCTDELYAWQLKNNPKEPFVLHDGPPYANGPLHTGHALNKIIKDIINRHRLLLGHKVHYTPGWDCHGLPIEVKALEKIKTKDHRTIDPMEIRKVARETAMAAVEIQKASFRRLSIMADWDAPYLTLQPEYEARQLRVFQHFLRDGLISRRRRPIYWSPSSKTALAEAELEYKPNHVSSSAYIRFPVDPASCPPSSPLSSILSSSPTSSVSLLIWTTTPWTLPANVAIAIHPDITYAIVRGGRPDDLWVVAEERVSALASTLTLPLEILSTLPGSALLGTRYYGWGESPKDCSRPILSAPYVTASSGTGLVHTAPGHGMEDYDLCNSLGLPAAFSPVDDAGRFSPDIDSLHWSPSPSSSLPIPPLAGLSVLKDGNRAILDLMGERGQLVMTEPYSHSYPYDWRTKAPVIQRSTSQWFANVGDIRRTVTQALATVETVPASGLARLSKYVADRKEWCISRQRVWGVPIPVFYETATDKPLLDDAVIDHVISLVEKHGTDIWWSAPIEQLLPEPYASNAQAYTRGYDTMDVWFDSGTSWTQLPQREGARADVYLEGSDQHRGWFQSSLLTSVAVDGKSPFSTIITHGFVLDESGRKMSKSIGNVLDPMVLVEGGPNKHKDPGYGSDMLRLWAASTEYVRDVSIGKTVLGHVIENGRKFRNTARFMLGNLNGYHLPSSIDLASLPSIERYMLHRLEQWRARVDDAYSTYAYSKVVQELNNFTNSDLSSFYLDISKDILYAGALTGRERTSIQYVLHQILSAYRTVLAPIQPHLAEEIYENEKALLVNSPHSQDSVFKEGWIKPHPEWLLSPEEEAAWSDLRLLRSSIDQHLETSRRDGLIKSSLEAKVSLTTRDPRWMSLLSSSDLPRFFIVSEVVIVEGDTSMESTTTTAGLPISIQVQKADLHKCPRCWNYTAPAEGDVCGRCTSVLSSTP